MNMGEYPVTTQTAKETGPYAAQLLILKIDGSYCFGVHGMKAGGKVHFNSRVISEPFNLKWKTESLFDGPITPGKPKKIRDDAVPGFYRFGFSDQKGYPFGIGVYIDGVETGTYMVYREEKGLLNLRVFIPIPQNNSLILFRASSPLDEEIEIHEVSPERRVIMRLDNKHDRGIWRLNTNRLGPVIFRVKPFDTLIFQMGGGEEAEIEIVPPDNCSRERSMTDMNM